MHKSHSPPSPAKQRCGFRTVGEATIYPITLATTPQRVNVPKVLSTSTEVIRGHRVARPETSAPEGALIVISSARLKACPDTNLLSRHRPSLRIRTFSGCGPSLATDLLWIRTSSGYAPSLRLRIFSSVTDLLSGYAPSRIFSLVTDLLWLRTFSSVTNVYSR